MTELERQRVLSSYNTHTHNKEERDTFLSSPPATPLCSATYWTVWRAMMGYELVS